MNYFDGVINVFEFVERNVIDDFINKNNIQKLIQEKGNNPMNVYLNKIIDDKLIDKEIMYGKFKDIKDEDNYIIFLNSELMDNYIKNLELLKNNLLIGKYSIPISYKKSEMFREYIKPHHSCNYFREIPNFPLNTGAVKCTMPRSFISGCNWTGVAETG